jgi:hypothetical protein
MNIILSIEGGIGKSIMATAVCEAIKKQYPKDDLIVLTAYTEVFLCNPNVYKCLNINNLQYFYRDFIEGKDVKLFLHNPYSETKFITREEHLLETWCEMFGINYNGEMPKLYLTEREENFYSQMFNSDKPIMVMQTNGGAHNQNVKYSWTRDIPYSVAQYVVNTFKEEYNIFHIRREDQIGLENTIPVHADFRALAVLIKMSSKRLLIDSFAQHTAQALGLDSIVTWVGNTPSQFGYDNNTNIIANEENEIAELKNSVFSKYQINGDLLEFPFKSENDIFNVEDIIEALREVKLSVLED